ncbi:aldehyde dehydrogenase [Sphingomonas sp. Root710]|uniref:aldehyde dehydrogenase family protein n=1 Tax=Sphingomonas sp. Root710 TaxID=1736594 RepID=UPI0006F4E9B2|nr:aldehyde dehydrogenase family protein [Sphingomonas sp. Root710]KRB82329.1 aldehyde dehydrogenase [Sphingomonas sp. Root710]
MPDYPMLINGELVAGAKQLEVLNPATGVVFATVERADEKMLDAAVAAAAAAQVGWAATSFDVRRAALLKLADFVEANAANIARMLVMEQGKPLPQAEMEVGFACQFIRYFVDQDLEPQLIQDDEQYHVEQRFKPLGVVAAIMPWNFPFMMAIYKLAPALLMGNAVILKPSPTTPVTTLMLAEPLRDLFPAGLVNIIIDQNDLGSALSGHPQVAKVSFTGSTATGRRVMEAAASSLKRLTLELGGNDAAIVLPDADIDKTADRAVSAAFFNAGQVCVAIKRLYVHRSIYEEMCEALAIRVQDIIVGDGLEQGTTMGPVQNAQQYEKLTRYLEVAERDGTIIAGGQRKEGPGYFIEPTLVRDIEDGSPLVDEEQFGPVLPIIAFDEVDDVIARANASQYGLGGSVWTADADVASSLADRLDTGTVWINHHLHFGPHIPFAGAKQSGIGSEFGREGLLEFSQRSVVNRAKN